MSMIQRTEIRIRELRLERIFRNFPMSGYARCAARINLILRNNINGLRLQNLCRRLRPMGKQIGMMAFRRFYKIQT